MVVFAALIALLAGSGLWTGTARADTTPPPPPPPLAHASIPPGPATPPAGVQGQAVSGGSPGYWDVTSSGVVAG
ncbi:MAG: hypothetical protein J2P58_14595, partial [Acidimicrobiaceae bacterium]|nr:hypothetical protein [Acidimicrobiaceae bacterium]